ncbi:hypothetical protein NSE_0130 [Neorickettsia sennetsu str. Miyayama]|uniref:Uncharacterized protein n=1 Tax=Ehrlichia sennetsu (strain ATCC VR-367 / Miyayama) TaxID=222891 RepID=Q2GER6_EHRS3|nr:hypothetical protein NSE_0130 [Neorickettsia sennetsu str. Miyayama]
MVQRGYHDAVTSYTGRPLTFSWLHSYSSVLTAGLLEKDVMVEEQYAAAMVHRSNVAKTASAIAKVSSAFMGFPGPKISPDKQRQTVSIITTQENAYNA